MQGCPSAKQVLTEHSNAAYRVEIPGCNDIQGTRREIIEMQDNVGVLFLENNQLGWCDLAGQEEVEIYKVNKAPHSFELS